MQRSVEQLGQLAWLITKRSKVRILSLLLGASDSIEPSILIAHEMTKIEGYYFLIEHFYN